MGGVGRVEVTISRNKFHNTLCPLIYTSLLNIIFWNIYCYGLN